MPTSDIETIHEFDIKGGWAIQEGKRVDPFDIVDALQGTGAKIYVHDLDGRARNRPQLDLVQDLSLEVVLWYDGGIRQSEGVIDPLVAGAEMVALDPAYLKGEVEFERVLKLTSNVFLDLLSEHEDRIPDFNKSITSGSGMTRLLSMGYQNFVIRPGEELAFENTGFEGQVNLYLRQGSPNEKSLPASGKIRGIVKDLSELVIEDES